MIRLASLFGMYVVRAHMGESVVFLVVSCLNAWVEMHHTHVKSFPKLRQMLMIQKRVWILY